MKKFILPLLGCRLFAGVKIEEIEELLDCFRVRSRKFEKDSYVFYRAVLRCAAMSAALVSVGKGDAHNRKREIIFFV
jgi:hypothetical protein